MALAVAMLGTLSLFGACTGSTDDGLPEEDPAASGQEDGKGDLPWADGQQGESCYYNWECDSTLDLVCRPKYNLNGEVVERTCQGKARKDNACDEDEDCADSAHQCVRTPIGSYCRPVAEGHPECIEDHLWCDGNAFKSCLGGHYFEFDCTETNEVCGNYTEEGHTLAGCITP
jgi:hypothetical protein